jgi:MFS family permease
MNRMKKNVWLLSLCQALMNSGNSLLIATSALVGYQLAADPSLATLPLALQFLATMLTSIPASMLMKHVGRRNGFLVGTALGLAGAGLAAWAIVHADFAWFCAGAALFGAFNGFGSYYRFAAADVATDDYRPTAISYVMAGGVIAAFVGPNLANWTSDWLASAQFAGSYLALVGIYAGSLVAQLFLDIPPPSAHEAHDSGRPLREIAAQGTFAVAVLAAALGYGIMALVMTATPLAMHAHAHPFHDTTFVIEWHILGMYAPSFITGHLIRRLGVLNIMLAGAVLNALCVAVNLAGTGLTHFWAGLVLLGVGWNFLFVGGTTLLTETYRIEEKAKTQALNDFLVFTAVTAASLSAGALQHLFGWQVVNLGVLPLIVLVFASVAWLKLRRRALRAARVAV